VRCLFRKLEKYLAPLWAIVVFIVSILPADDITIDSDMLIPHADKVVHIMMYFILQVAMMRKRQSGMEDKNKVIIFILVSGYGVFIELFQGYFLADRFFEIYDIIANITGALMGILLFNRIKS
jgi:VanZ family protein